MVHTSGQPAYTESQEASAISNRRLSPAGKFHRVSFGSSSVRGLSAGKIDIAWMSGDPGSDLPVCPAAGGCRRAPVCDQVAQTVCEVLPRYVDSLRSL